ncbi:uncharacterized protein G2W53_004754 [Senna tora]|uniref:Uncharacterized protein n=1 Tax=Senna tora TaxID=362788 RepID=A0A835CGQ9_9FABA|nr:uncharacterized protein G2W53_004754 [Senna tora]
MQVVMPKEPEKPVTLVPFSSFMKEATKIGLRGISKRASVTINLDKTSIGLRPLHKLRAIAARRWQCDESFSIISEPSLNALSIIAPSHGAIAEEKYTRK